MKAPIYAVIDTNVIVSGLMKRNECTPPAQILDIIELNILIPILNGDIFKEYQEVLTRTKLKLDPIKVTNYLKTVIDNGIHMDPTHYDGDMPDEKDRVFYEVSLTGDSYLVTGNKKHFPVAPKVVTPAQMIEIINSLEWSEHHGDSEGSEG